MSDYDELIQAAARVAVDIPLRLLDADHHQWSSRPCSTCRAISAVAGWPFGCNRLAKEQENRLKP
jgi:hypothetical protein